MRATTAGLPNHQSIAGLRLALSTASQAASKAASKAAPRAALLCLVILALSGCALGHNREPAAPAMLDLSVPQVMAQLAAGELTSVALVESF